MAGVTADLELRIDRALQGVDRLENSLRQAVQGFSVDLARALEVAGGKEVRVKADASPVTGAIDAAIANATTETTVTADAAEVTGSVTSAVDAADTAVEVTGEAAQVTGAVDAAVDAANTGVEVTAEASSVTGAIDAAIADANTAVTVTAQAQGFDAIGSQAREVSEELGSAGSSAGLLAGGLLSARGAAGLLGGALAGAGVVSFFRSATDAASDLTESTNKANQVFKDAIGPVEQFAETSATSVGLAKQQFFEAAGTLGNLFTALGLSRDQAAGFSTRMVELGADLASFNNIPVDDALERIRAGLVGEIEPLRRMGISFNAAQVEAKALELGLADAGGEISESAKVQARYALILDQTTNAQGDFARTSGDLANLQRIASAEFRDAQAALGQALLPVLKELVTVAREDVIPAVVTFGEVAGPVLATGLGILATALGPPLQLLTELADLLSVIPAPVLAVTAGLAGLTKGLAVLGGGGGIAGVVGGGLRLTSMIGAINPAVAIAGVGLLGVTKVLAGFRRETEEARNTAKAFADVLGEEGEAAEANRLELLKNEFERRNVVSEARRAGVSLAEVSAAINGDTQALERLRQAQREAADAAAHGEARSASQSKALRLLVDDVEELVTAEGEAVEIDAERRAAADAVSLATTGMTTAVAAQHDAVRAAAPGIAEYAQTHGLVPPAADLSTEAVEAFTKSVQDQVEPVSSAIGTIDESFSPEKLLEELEERRRAVESFSVNVQTLIDQGFTEIARLALERGPEAGGIIAQKFLEAQPGIRTATDAALGQVGAAIVDLKDNRIPPLVALLEIKAGTDVGRAIAEGMAKGIAERSPQIESAVVDAVGRAVVAGERRARISSPSQLFAERLGIPIAEGIAEGINSATPSIEEALRAAVSPDLDSVARAAVSPRLPALTLASSGRSSASTAGALAFHLNVTVPPGTTEPERFGARVAEGVVATLQSRAAEVRAAVRSA